MAEYSSARLDRKLGLLITRGFLIAGLWWNGGLILHLRWSLGEVGGY
jgi:hypothetical protein